MSHQIAEMKSLSKGLHIDKIQKNAKFSSGLPIDSWRGALFGFDLSKLRYSLRSTFDAVSISLHNMKYYHKSLHNFVMFFGVFY